MSVVLGIDPSLTATGLAFVPDHGAEPRTHTVRSSGRAADTLSMRHARLTTISEQVCAAVADHGAVPVLAVIEGPSHGSRGGSAWDRAGLWWQLITDLHAEGVPVAVCAPTTRIKWATGTGRATASTKSDVAVALSRLWPGVDADGDNEWDALAMATIGAQHLGWAVPSRAHHEASRRAVAWPHLPESTP